MKTITCIQLGGACDQKLSANIFDEIVMLVSKHAREMVPRVMHLILNLDYALENCSLPFFEGQYQTSRFGKMV